MSGYIKDRPTQAVAFTISSQTGDGLKTVVLLPAGVVKSLKGTYLVDDEGARMVIAAFKKHGTSVPIDFEHQTLGGTYAAPDGLARAAGWIESIFYDSVRGLQALVKWNDRARAMIRADEYRYISPVAIVRKSDRRVVAIDSAAVTNRPAIPGMERIAASAVGADLERVVMDDSTNTNEPGKNEAMDILRKIKEAMNLPETATALDVLKAVLESFTVKAVEGDATMAEANAVGSGEATAEQKMGELKVLLESKGAELDDVASFVDILNAAIAIIKGEKPTEDRLVAANVRRTLELPTDADGDTVTLALSMKLANARLADELAARDRNDADRLVDEQLETYINTGVLNVRWAEQMAAARALALKDVDLFEAIMSRAEPIIPQGRTTAPDPTPLGRSRVIREALIAFTSDPQTRKLTSAVAFGNMKLSEAGMNPLTDEEAKRLTDNAAPVGR